MKRLLNQEDVEQEVEIEVEGNDDGRVAGVEALGWTWEVTWERT